MHVRLRARSGVACWARIDSAAPSGRNPFARGRAGSCGRTGHIRPIAQRGASASVPSSAGQRGEHPSRTGPTLPARRPHRGSSVAIRALPRRTKGRGVGRRVFLHTRTDAAGKRVLPRAGADVHAVPGARRRHCSSAPYPPPRSSLSLRPVRVRRDIHLATAHARNPADRGEAPRLQRPRELRVGWSVVTATRNDRRATWPLDLPDLRVAGGAGPAARAERVASSAATGVPYQSVGDSARPGWPRSWSDTNPIHLCSTRQYPQSTR